MLRATLGIGVALIASILITAPAAHAYSYGQTSCGYDPALARADQALRVATDTDIYMRQNLANAYNTPDATAVPVAAEYVARADARYQRAKLVDDQIRAADEAACKPH